MNRKNARVAIYSLAGVYLLYVAYQLYTGLEDDESHKVLFIVFSIVFTIIGAAGVIYGIYYSFKHSRQMYKERLEEAQRNQKTLKEKSLGVEEFVEIEEKSDDYHST